MERCRFQNDFWNGLKLACISLFYAFRDCPQPENILLDEKGHIRLADFGFAKIVPIDGKTYTMCGEYISSRFC